MLYEVITPYFRKRPVFENKAGDLVRSLQLLQHIHVRRVARLRLLDRRESELLEKEKRELLGGIDVDVITSYSIHYTKLYEFP